MIIRIYSVIGKLSVQIIVSLLETIELNLEVIQLNITSGLFLLLFPFCRC